MCRRGRLTSRPAARTPIALAGGWRRVVGVAHRHRPRENFNSGAPRQEKYQQPTQPVGPLCDLKTSGQDQQKGAWAASEPKTSSLPSRCRMCYKYNGRLHYIHALASRAVVHIHAAWHSVRDAPRCEQGSQQARSGRCSQLRVRLRQLRLKVVALALELLVLSLQSLDVDARGSTEGHLDEIDGVGRLLGLLVQADEHCAAASTNGRRVRKEKAQPRRSSRAASSSHSICYVERAPLVSASMTPALFRYCRNSSFFASGAYRHGCKRRR